MGCLQTLLFDAVGRGDWAADHRHRAIREELLVQRSLERRWRDLVRTVAPEAANQDTVFAWLQVVVALAIELANLTVSRHDELLELRAPAAAIRRGLSYIARRM